MIAVLKVEKYNYMIHTGKIMKSIYRLKNVSLLFISIILIFSLLTGCSRIDYSLPKAPIEFSTGTFVNQNDPDDSYQSIDYNGRTYIPYGTLQGRITGKDVGACLGFIVQNGIKDENSRVYLLTEDPDANFLVNFYIGGIMDQPMFYRALDTTGRPIPTPSFINDLGYEYWK